MYSKYKHCASYTPVHPTASQSCCVTKESMPGPGAIPESSRLAARRCGTIWVTVPPRSSCGSSGGGETANEPEKVEIPITASDVIPVQTVETTPASATVRLTAERVRQQESNPYNPATRFAQYFPAPPLPYVCPERIPNNGPAARISECVPVARYSGSVVGR